MLFFFFNDTATTEIYTLSLHDALPIFVSPSQSSHRGAATGAETDRALPPQDLPHVRTCRLVGSNDAPQTTHSRSAQPDSCGDRKSTRLNSSHANISYAVFCLKKKTTSS